MCIKPWLHCIKFTDVNTWALGHTRAPIDCGIEVIWVPVKASELIICQSSSAGQSVPMPPSDQYPFQRTCPPRSFSFRSCRSAAASCPTTSPHQSFRRAISQLSHPSITQRPNPHSHTFRVLSTHHHRLAAPPAAARHQVSSNLA